MRLLPPTLQWILLLLLLLQCFKADDESNNSSPPKNSEQYDASILDPNTVYGSPYGGFSRATRSRLAALPLKLPDLLIPADAPWLERDTPNSNNEVVYMETGDAVGRRYVCRVYTEDKLQDKSMEDGMFEPPVLIEPDNNGAQEKRQLSKERDEQVSGQASMSTNQPKKTPPIVQSALEELETKREKNIMEQRIELLAGICADRVQGWWTYEWCYQKHVYSFHDKFDKSGRDIGIEGTMQAHVMEPFAKELLGVPRTRNEVDKEFGQIVEEYSSDDICHPTGKRRWVSVRVFCCSEKTTKRYLGNDGNPQTSDLAVASLAKVSEDGYACNYKIHVCTPLLCADTDMTEYQEFFDELGWSKADNDKNSNSNSSSTVAESVGGMSVRQILNGTLGKACLKSSTGGWWTYEYCHRKHVRQYHEQIVVGMKEGKLTSWDNSHPDNDEKNFMLGYFDVTLYDYADDDEWKHVVNMTSDGGGDGRHVSTSLGGNGAYFEQEYIDGEMCKRASKNNGNNKNVNNDNVARSSSVRYSCGETYSVTVREDITCHYIVDVTVPSLCHHPFFKPPVSKRRVVKCLPVVEPGF